MAEAIETYFLEVVQVTIATGTDKFAPSFLAVHIGYLTAVDVANLGASHCGMALFVAVAAYGGRLARTVRSDVTLLIAATTVTSEGTSDTRIGTVRLVVSETNISSMARI